MPIATPGQASPGPVPARAEYAPVECGPAPAQMAVESPPVYGLRDRRSYDPGPSTDVPRPPAPAGSRPSVLCLPPPGRSPGRRRLPHRMSGAAVRTWQPHTERVRHAWTAGRRALTIGRPGLGTLGIEHLRCPVEEPTRGKEPAGKATGPLRQEAHPAPLAPFPRPAPCARVARVPLRPCPPVQARTLEPACLRRHRLGRGTRVGLRRSGRTSPCHGRRRPALRKRPDVPRARVVRDPRSHHPGPRFARTRRHPRHGLGRVRLLRQPAPRRLHLAPDPHGHPPRRRAPHRRTRLPPCAWSSPTSSATRAPNGYAASNT